MLLPWMLIKFEIEFKFSFWNSQIHCWLREKKEFIYMGTHRKKKSRNIKWLKAHASTNTQSWRFRVLAFTTHIDCGRFFVLLFARFSFNRVLLCPPPLQSVLLSSQIHQLTRTHMTHNTLSIIHARIRVVSFSSHILVIKMHTKTKIEREETVWYVNIAWFALVQAEQVLPLLSFRCCSVRFFPHSFGCVLLLMVRDSYDQQLPHYFFATIFLGGKFKYCCVCRGMFFFIDDLFFLQNIRIEFWFNCYNGPNWRQSLYV